MKKNLVLWVSILVLSWAKTIVAQDNSRLRISLITCTPGNELYSIFGHSAIRVVDSNSLTDVIYNYGTFNFDDPNFYTKFMRGKLLYYVSVQQTQDFILDYQYMQRGIIEQELQLDATEKKFIRDSLQSNLKEQNKYYKYDFFFDNCTTRLRDLIFASLQHKKAWPAVMPTTTTYRQAIHQYLDQGKQYWSKLGIDLLLGLHTDRVMSAAEQEFLPDNLKASIEADPTTHLVASTKPIYIAPNQADDDTLWNPGLVITFFSLIWGASTFILGNRMKKVALFLDRTLFLLTGLLGLLLTIMWAFTDHRMTVFNLNLLWAWPLNFIIALLPKWRTRMLQRYFILQGSILLLLLATWYFLPQQLHLALIPFVVLLTIRSLYLANSIKKTLYKSVN